MSTPRRSSAASDVYKIQIPYYPIVSENIYKILNKRNIKTGFKIHNTNKSKLINNNKKQYQLLTNLEKQKENL